MASLNSLYIKTETLKTLFQTLEKKGEAGVEFTISINDELNPYGQNISAYVAQSKEDREAKKSRYYVGNGTCFWNDGKIMSKKDIEANAPQVEDAEVVDEDDDLPF